MCTIQYGFKLLIMLCFAFVSSTGFSECNKINERINIIKLLENSPVKNIDILEEFLNDDDPVIRRTSARILIEYFSGNKEKLESIYNNKDPIVSRTALQKIFDNFPEQSLIVAEDALKNKDEIVKNMVISNLVNKKPYNPKILELIKLAQRDTNATIKAVAVKALWPFHRDKELIRERVDYDYEVAVKSTIQAPKDKWLFRADPNEFGHYENWFAPEVNEAEWGLMDIESYWQDHGYNYQGVAWYRKSVEFPEKPSQVAVELRFDSICESAWIWVNGTYVGEHDEGPAGWDQPFAVDITDEIKWAQKNIIAVRVFSSLPHAGGIWKSVRIEILDKVSP